MMVERVMFHVCSQDGHGEKPQSLAVAAKAGAADADEAAAPVAARRYKGSSEQEGAISYEFCNATQRTNSTRTTPHWRSPPCLSLPRHILESFWFSQMCVLHVFQCNNDDLLHHVAPQPANLG